MAPNTEDGMADRNDNFLREVEEEVRREQLANIWDKYGVLLIAAAAAVVLGIGGWKFMQHQRIVNAQALGARFEAAQTLANEGKTDEALKAFEAIGKESSSGYQALAQLRSAGDLAKSGKRQEAIAVYEAMSKNGSVDIIFTQLARLQAALLRSGTADWTEMQNRLNDLVQDTSQWRHPARELQAVEAIRAGKLDDARKVLNQLMTDPKTPNDMAKRAQELLAMVAGQELAAATPKSSESTASPPAKAN